MKKIYSILKPDFYDKFSCKGSSCNYHCCRDWRIDLTKDEYHKWKKAGIFDKKDVDDIVSINNSSHAYANIHLNEQNACPFLSEEHLCEIQLKHGSKMLSQVCRQFPRIVHGYCGKLEYALSLGCEAVLELLLNEKEGICLETENIHFKPDLKLSTAYGINTRTKSPSLKSYYDIQALFLMILQAEGETMENKLILLGIALRHIDELYANNKGDKASEYIEQFLSEVEHFSVLDIIGDIEYNDGTLIINNLLSLFSSTDKTNVGLTLIFDKIKDRIEWNETIDDKSGEHKISLSLEKVPEYRKHFKEWSKDKEYFIENIMVAYMMYSNIPFKDNDLSLWNNFVYFVYVYCEMKTYLGILLDEESTDEDMIHYLTVFFRKLGHNKALFYTVINDFKKEENSLAKLAILLYNS